MKSDIVHIGVDVSKGKLYVYNPVTDEVSELPNDAAGFRKVREMARKGKAVVCCEPTGGYELDMVLFLQRFGVPVAYCDGYRVRHYALSTGEFSKNDRVDARMIARFADCTPVRTLAKKDLSHLELRRRWKLYQTLVDMHVVLAQKASSEPEAETRTMLRAESARMEKKAAKALRSCVELAKGDERMSYLLGRFVEIDGVAEKTAIAVIAGVPEIGSIGDAALSKLVGLVPMDNQSGAKDHAKKIRGGRKDVRRALYLAALPAVQHNHVLSAYYKEVKKRIPSRKAAKWAFVPVMRKLIHLMNRLARDPEFQLQKKRAA